MAIRQEQIVFIAALGILGWWAYRDSKAPREDRVPSKRGEAEFVHHDVPDVSVSLPIPGRDTRFGRDLFSPPRDTAPLPPLVLQLPPIEPLDALRPPGPFGPGARTMNAHLRVRPTSTPVPGLFEVPLALDGEGGDEQQPDLQDVGDAAISWRAMTPAQRAERLAAYKRLYDWIEADSELKFGQIRNKDRYRLRERPQESVLFVQIDPDTGAERWPGLAPVPYEPARVTQFGFADTPINFVELERVALGDSLSASTYQRALTFAARCLELRHEAPRALEVAEEVTRMAIAISVDDLAPHLLLARCFEASFRFEQVFELYRELLDAHPTNPELSARMGDLYARFRMPARAEQHYLRALQLSKSNWFALWRYGRFLLDVGRADEAVAQLASAQSHEPSASASLDARRYRLAIRNDFGWALQAHGDLRAAVAQFERALQVDQDDQQAAAGLVSSALFAPAAAGDDDPVLELLSRLDASRPDASSELLIALGLRALDQGDWHAARRQLDAAAAADPFHAFRAWRALSWLAEVTEHPEEALTYIGYAYQNDPTDPWTLYQRGRLLAQQDDLEGAEESLRAALDQELDFADALIAMGRLSQQRGDHLAAERYYERALLLDEARPIVHSLRGFNFFELGDDDAAEESFRRALRHDQGLASARNGLAWSKYVQGDSGEAITQFGELLERLRNAPLEDPHKVYAEAQAARILDHEEKQVWTDRFERVPGHIANGWGMTEGFGPVSDLAAGAVRMLGTFDAFGRTRVLRNLPVDQFLSFEATVTIGRESKGVRVGIFVSREREGRTSADAQVQAEVNISRSQDGAVQAGFIKQGQVDVEYQDLFTTPWVVGAPMRLKIERVGEGSDTVVNLYVDELPVLEGVKMARLGTSTQNATFGVFVEGDRARTADVTFDDVRVVRRRRN